MENPTQWMTGAYIAFCEAELWVPWRAGTLTVPPPFDPNIVPEPYISFSAKARPLVALLTNPGPTMCHQTRAAVEAGDGPLSKKDEYAEAARKLSWFYERELAGRLAGRRISGLSRSFPRNWEQVEEQIGNRTPLNRVKQGLPVPS
jgi:hypothetical protein